MDPEALLEAITKHLDLLQSITEWAFFFSLAVGWAGLQGKEVTGLGMTFSRKQAFRAACCIYVAVSLVVFCLLWRIGSLLNMIDADPDHLRKAITQLATNSWLANPVSYFGPYPVYNSLGYGCLILLWWLCTAALLTLTDRLLTKANAPLLTVFAVLGLAIVVAANRLGHIIRCKSVSVWPALHDSFHPSSEIRVIAPVVGFVLGTMIVGAVYISVRRERQESRDKFVGED